MYLVDLFAADPLADLDAQLACALDADRDQAERIASLHRLRGAPDARRSEIGRALIPVLNEPRHFLGCEALLCIRALAPDLLLGRVDGRWIASPSALAVVERDGPRLICPSVGDVAPLLELADLDGADALPWLAVTPAYVVIDVDGERQLHTYHRWDSLMLGAGHARVRARMRADDIVIERDATAAYTVRVNGDPLDATRSAVRAIAGAVVEIRALPGQAKPGSVTVRLLRVRPATSPFRASLAIDNVDDDMPVMGRTQLGHARNMFGGHVVALGPREIGVVHPRDVRRVLWTEDDVGSTVARVASLEVQVVGHEAVRVVRVEPRSDLELAGIAARLTERD